MEINGLDLVENPSIVLEIILKEYENCDKVDVSEDIYDKNIIHINDDKYLVLKYYEIDDIIDDFNNLRFEEFIKDVPEKILDYIDEGRWHKVNDVNDIEDTDYDNINFLFEEGHTSVYKIND